mmetsp:Transcript_38012/g.37513  ORF Transcript_38012/g.37513 Transcript_38012/m.37513 type:complete len:125 (+) Transcript_38012:112-486(+)
MKPDEDLRIIINQPIESDNLPTYPPSLPFSKCSFQRLDISHGSNLNNVKVDEDFKEMTKRLVDLADHVTGESSPPRRKSVKARRKIKGKKRNDRMVTWDQSSQKEYFDMDQKMKQIVNPRKISE